MTATEFYAKHGARKTARQLISMRIRSLAGGLTIDDVPDTAELCSLVDDLDGIIEGYDGSLVSDEAKKEIREFIDENINEDTIESLIIGE